MLKNSDPQIDSLIRFGLALAIFAIIDLVSRGVLGYLLLWIVLLTPLILILPMAKLASLFGLNLTQEIPQWLFGVDSKLKALVLAAVLLGISIYLKTSNNRALRILSLVFWFHALIIGMVLISFAIGGEKGIGR